MYYCQSGDGPGDRSGWSIFVPSTALFADNGVCAHTGPKYDLPAGPLHRSKRAVPSI